jgi:lysophospholipase L1-like esterase
MISWTYRIVTVGLVAGVLASASSGAEDCVQYRKGLPNCPYKLTPGTWINTIFLGSSTTAGEAASTPGRSYPMEVMRYLRATFPGSSGGSPLITGGKGSWWGAFCAARGQAVYGEHMPGAILFVELAVDDSGATEDQMCTAIEGLVRQVWTKCPAMDIVFLYGLRKDDLNAYKNGKLPSAIQWHEKVAEHYGIPSVNMGRFVARKLLTGEITFDVFSKDGIHPTDRGHALYAEGLIPNCP